MKKKVQKGTVNDFILKTQTWECYEGEQRQI